MEQASVPPDLTDQGVRDYLLTNRGTELAEGGAPAVPAMPRQITPWNVESLERDVYAETVAAHGFDPLSERDERMVKS